MKQNSKRRVTPDVEPGYLKLMVPLEPPQESEDWDKIMKDVEDKIMPGVFKYLILLINLNQI